MTTDPTNFTEFWDFYVSEHSLPMTRLLHFVGTTLGMVLLVWFIAFGRYLFIPLCFVSGYAFAWFGHFAIEKNRPATFKFPALVIYLRLQNESFARLVDELEGFTDQGVDPRGKPPTALDNSPYGKELNWILGLEDKSEDYANRLYDVYRNAPVSSVTYPERYPFNAPKGSMRNGLTPQLQLIARLLDGGGPGLGVKTKVFLVKMGGFDTHAEQVESYDPTMGQHAALMYHISSAMKAFQDDLKARGLEDRVLTLTTSEFGRRVRVNGSYGTDHGTGAPVMIFGKGVQPGVVGKVPIALLRAREAVMGPIREMLAQSGISEQKWRVLRVLQENGPLELTLLAHEACLLLPSLTRMVRPMEDEGLIRRTTPKGDRRKVVVAITEGGQRLVASHSGDSAAIFARIEAGFGHDRLEDLLDLLEDLQRLDLRGGDSGR